MPGAFTKPILGEFPPKLPTLWVFLLTTRNGFAAVVIADDADEARRTALMHDPRGWWHTAASDQVSLGERLKLLFTGRLWLRIMIFGERLQPQQPGVDCPFERKR